MRRVGGRLASRTSADSLLRARRRREGEHGQMVVVFALTLVVILAFAAIVVDLAVLRNNRQILVNAFDAGALAGGYYMPIDGTAGTPTSVANVEARINTTVDAAYHGLPTSAYTITYRCVVGVDPNTGNAFISRDVPLVCDPHYSLGTSIAAMVANPNAYFIGAGKTRTSTCDPRLGDRCNTVVVTGAATTPFGFGPVVGVNSGSTGTVTSAACQGPCGAPPSIPVDLVVIIDRTASMNGHPGAVTATRDAANAVLGSYDPAIQRVALGLLGPSLTSSTCSGSPAVNGLAIDGGHLAEYGTTAPVPGSPGSLKNWIPIGFTGTMPTQPGDPIGFNEAYVSSPGTLNPSSHIVAAINCFNSPGGTGTNLAEPLKMAKAYLDMYGRPGIPWGILLETDGEPNNASGLSPATDFTCAGVDAAATAAKTDPAAYGGGIEIFTVGFGLDGSQNLPCPDGGWLGGGKRARDLLAHVATQPSVDGGCPGTSNSDGDHFFCEPFTSDLTTVFQTVATSFAHTGAKLLRLYPTPVVTSVSPSTGSESGGYSVTINGAYFTGATGVQFGSAPASFSVVNDTTIVATAPSVISGGSLVVHVIVTTGGGSSPMIAADQFTFTSP